MERIKVSKLLILLTALLVLNPKTEGQVMTAPAAPRPLCVSEFQLANHACESVPFTPSPPPGPPGDGSPPEDDGGRRRHRSHHRIRQNVGTPVEQDCCRWLTAIDVECVCDLLVHLPSFLSRPNHEYTVSVGDVCTSVFRCSSRLKE